MPLTKEAIEEFRDIWRREFNEELSFDQAKIEAQNLLAFAWKITALLPGGPGYSEPIQKDSLVEE